MLDDRRGKAVAAIGDFGHPPAYPRPRLPSYPVTLTTPEEGIAPTRSMFLLNFDLFGLCLVESAITNSATLLLAPPPAYRARSWLKYAGGYGAATTS